MKPGQKFVTVLALIVLVSFWLMERPRIQQAWATVEAGRKPAPTAPASTGGR